MSLKPTPLAAVLMALAGILPLSGCSGDECTKAADHFAECMPLGSSTGTGGPDTAQQCDGDYLCQSQCINKTSCDAIKGAYELSKPDDSVTFLNCMAECTK